MSWRMDARQKQRHMRTTPPCLAQRVRTCAWDARARVRLRNTHTHARTSAIFWNTCCTFLLVLADTWAHAAYTTASQQGDAHARAGDALALQRTHRRGRTQRHWHARTTALAHRTLAHTRAEIKASSRNQTGKSTHDGSIAKSHHRIVAAAAPPPSPVQHTSMKWLHPKSCAFISPWSVGTSRWLSMSHLFPTSTTLASGHCSRKSSIHDSAWLKLFHPHAVRPESQASSRAGQRRRTQVSAEPERDEGALAQAASESYLHHPRKRDAMQKNQRRVGCTCRAA